MWEIVTSGDLEQEWPTLNSWEEGNGKEKDTCTINLNGYLFKHRIKSLLFSRNLMFSKKIQKTETYRF